MWDRELPELTLKNVRVHADSLNEAWQAFSTRHLARSVLVSMEGSASMPFSFEAAECTVQAFHDALSATYGLKSAQDERTGVTWLFPSALRYDRLLTEKLQVPKPQAGLPMHTGILEPVEANPSTKVAVKAWSSLFLNTFDYAVNIPAGGNNVRDLLNQCCVANPSKTFLVSSASDKTFITDVNIAPDKDEVSEGALLWWKTEVTLEPSLAAPNPKQVIDALADAKTNIRHAARNYLETIIAKASFAAWADLSPSTAHFLWLCIGVASVLVRSEQATHLAVIAAMRERMHDDFLITCEPSLAVVSALELARLTKETKPLEIVANRNFASVDLAPVSADACRVAAISPFVRMALKAENVNVLLKSMPQLTDLLHSPTPGKLEFM